MNQDQGTVLRSGRVIDSSSETESPADPNMAQANSNDSDTNDSSDISSQLSEIKESYERRINELHHEFSQLKDLMMAIVTKNSSESQPSSSKGPSKPAQQHGYDMSGIINGPYYDQTEIKLDFCCSCMQFVERISNFENCHLQRLNAEPIIEPRSTFCISERCIAGLNAANFLAELTSKYF